MATANTILNLAQRYLGFDRSDIGITGLEEAQLLEVCNQAVIEYFEAHRMGGGEPPTMFQKEHGAALTADTTTAEALTTALTDFDLTSATDFATSGVLAVWDNEEPDYITYTGKSSNNLTGVTGIGYAHATGLPASRLYPLPSDFSDFRSEPNSPDGVRVDGTPYQHTGGVPIGNTFHLYDNGTTKYLHFPQGLTGSMSVRYNSKPTTVNDTADTVDVPEKDQWFVVWRICEYAAPILGEMEKFEIATRRAQLILNHALIARNIGKRPKVRTMRSPYLWNR